MIIHRQENFECIIPERNKSAFYLMVAGRDLFGYILIRRWGRIGTKGQPKLQMRFTTEEDLFQEYNRVRKERLKREYRVIPHPVSQMEKREGERNSFVQEYFSPILHSYIFHQLSPLQEKSSAGLP